MMHMTKPTSSPDTLDVSGAWGYGVIWLTQQITVKRPGAYCDSVCSLEPPLAVQVSASEVR